MQNWINKQSDGAKILVFVAVFGVIVIPAIILTVGISVVSITRVSYLVNPDVCDAVCCILRG